MDFYMVHNKPIMTSYLTYSRRYKEKSDCLHSRKLTSLLISLYLENIVPLPIEKVKHILHIYVTASAFYNTDIAILQLLTAALTIHLYTVFNKAASNRIWQHDE